MKSKKKKLEKLTRRFLAFQNNIKKEKFTRKDLGF